MLSIPKVAQYARFSSDNQRSESIDAQIRAMNQFCKQNHRWHNTPGSVRITREVNLSMHRLEP